MAGRSRGTRRPLAASKGAVGRLTVVGLGYLAGAHCTAETEAHLIQADHLLYLSADPITSAWLESLNPNCESLHPLYREGEGGLNASHRMVDRILRSLHRRRRVTAAFYGHPAIYLHTSHEAISQARRHGFEAKMFPAVSAVDCLLADLSLDVSDRGYQLFEATDLLLYRRRFDPGCTLILLQIGALGETLFRSEAKADPERIRLLMEYLMDFYPPDHPSIRYECAPLPIWEPVVQKVPLRALAETPVTEASTLVILPLRSRR